jgi:hypothetical protein
LAKFFSDLPRFGTAGRCSSSKVEKRKEAKRKKKCILWDSNPRHQR